MVITKLNVWRWKFIYHDIWQSKCFTRKKLVNHRDDLYFPGNSVNHHEISDKAPQNQAFATIFASGKNIFFSVKRAISNKCLINLHFSAINQLFVTIKILLSNFIEIIMCWNDVNNILPWCLLWIYRYHFCDEHPKNDMFIVVKKCLFRELAGSAWATWPVGYYVGLLSCILLLRGPSWITVMDYYEACLLEILHFRITSRDYYLHLRPHPLAL